jgi:hypothetical protein
MSFRDELRAVDPERVTAIFNERFGPDRGSSVPEEERMLAVFTEQFMADEFPALHAIKEALQAHRAGIVQAGYSHETVDVMLTGIDMARIVLAAYAMEEE